MSDFLRKWILGPSCYRASEISHHFGRILFNSLLHQSNVLHSFHGCDVRPHFGERGQINASDRDPRQHCVHVAVCDGETVIDEKLLVVSNHMIVAISQTLVCFSFQMFNHIRMFGLFIFDMKRLDWTQSLMQLSWDEAEHILENYVWQCPRNARECPRRYLLETADHFWWSLILAIKVAHLISKVLQYTRRFIQHSFFFWNNDAWHTSFGVNLAIIFARMCSMRLWINFFTFYLQATSESWQERSRSSRNRIIIQCRHSSAWSVLQMNEWFWPETSTWLRYDERFSVRWKDPKFERRSKRTTFLPSFVWRLLKFRLFIPFSWSPSCQISLSQVTLKFAA